MGKVRGSRMEERFELQTSLDFAKNFFLQSFSIFSCNFFLKENTLNPPPMTKQLLACWGKGPSKVWLFPQVLDLCCALLNTLFCFQ